MSDPWLTIIGLGEDGPEGLGDASRRALDVAEVIFGGPRHLELVGAGKRGRAWPIPFEIDPVLAEKGRKVIVLASGDPYWFGAGGSLSGHLGAGEWRAFPAPSTFSLAAARLGWRIEDVLCLGLHAAPFDRLQPMLTEGQRMICLVRDGEAPAALARYLVGAGFGASTLAVLEALGGPRERVRTVRADAFDLADVAAPVAVAVSCAGGKGLSRAAGLPDDLFASDGQITKRPIRALTLSALAPRAGEVLWDLGAGSGSISVEWCLAAPGTRAIAIEERPERAENIRLNLTRFGVDHRLTVMEGSWREKLAALATPDAVFVGGGLDKPGLEALWAALPAGCRLVANSVTIETEMLLAHWQQERGGDLMRFDFARAMPLGRMKGWVPGRTVVQWSGVK